MKFARIKNLKEFPNFNGMPVEIAGEKLIGDRFLYAVRTLDGGPIRVDEERVLGFLPDSNLTILELLPKFQEITFDI